MVLSIHKCITVRSRDVQCIEDQTIEDINKVRDIIPEKDSNLTDGNSMRLFVHNLNNVETNAQNNEKHDDVDDQQVGDEIEVPIDDAQEERDMMLMNLSEGPVGLNTIFHVLFS